MFKHIFVTTDGSALAAQALPLAARLAETCGADLTVAYAVPTPVGIYDGPSLVDPGLAYDELCAAGQQILTDAARELGAGTHTRLVDARGQFIADALLRAAQGARADVIVMATHGRTGLLHLLLGSVAGRVLSRSDVPVLLQREVPVPANRTPVRAPGAQPPQG